MSSSPYTPPKTTAVDNSVQPPASAFKSVAIGLAVDIGGSMAVGTAMAFVYAGMLVSEGMEPEQIVEALTNIPPTSTFSIVGIVVGLFISGLAGFVCARLSRRRDYKLGLIMGGIAGAVSFISGYGIYSLPMNAVIVAATFAAILIGMKVGMPRAARADAFPPR